MPEIFTKAVDSRVNKADDVCCPAFPEKMYENAEGYRRYDVRG